MTANGAYVRFVGKAAGLLRSLDRASTGSVRR